MTKTKLTPIVGNAQISDYGSESLSALTPFETSFVEFTINNEKYVWWSDKTKDIPQNGKVLLLAWATSENTLRRVFISWKNSRGIMRSAGMNRADKSLVTSLFNK